MSIRGVGRFLARLRPPSPGPFLCRVRAWPKVGARADAFGERMRHGLAASLDRLSRALSSPLTEAELDAPGLVFAPHPDDETLGCGGTILLKRSRGADVGVAFLTDGSKSHAALVSPEILADERHLEALEACRRLGVPERAVTWMGFPDGELARHARAAVSRVVELLTERQPHVVFAPLPVNEHPDHVATGRIVRAALRRAPLEAPVTLLEYPIWFWHHFPWVSLRDGDPGLLEKTRAARFGLRVLTHLDVRVDVRAVRREKRAALAAHKSQMERRNGDPRWWTLGDVSGGELLSRLLADAERFRRIRVGGCG